MKRKLFFSWCFCRFQLLSIYLILLVLWNFRLSSQNLAKHVMVREQDKSRNSPTFLLSAVSVTPRTPWSYHFVCQSRGKWTISDVNELKYKDLLYTLFGLWWNIRNVCYFNLKSNKLWNIIWNITIGKYKNILKYFYRDILIN